MYEGYVIRGLCDSIACVMGLIFLDIISHIDDWNLSSSIKTYMYFIDFLSMMWYIKRVKNHRLVTEENGGMYHEISHNDRQRVWLWRQRD